MATAASASWDLSTSFLGLPATEAYGLVRGAGNLGMQQALSDGTRVSFYILGKGPWKGISELWINDALVGLPNVAVHFHQGFEGEIGNGLSAVSTGPDQHVDSFFTSLPSALVPVTFSGYAWLALKTPPDPDAPSADLTVLGTYQARMVRLFDNLGNQTSFDWTQNWAYIIADYLIRKFVLREAKPNQPLVAAELARFDWQSFHDSAAYCDAVLGAGQARFSDGGVVYASDASDTADSALEQMLLMCRGYLMQRNGKFTLYIDQPRSSVFTFNTDNVKPGTLKVYRDSSLRSATNQIIPSFRDLNFADGSTDDATKFAIATDPTLNHYAHQIAIGTRGPGLSVMPVVKPLNLDFGANTPERVWRIEKAMLVRQLGDDVPDQSDYQMPWSVSLTASEAAAAVETGDVCEIDSSLSEEYGGLLFEVQEVDDQTADGTRNFIGLEYEPNAFPDVAPDQQATIAPDPGSGLSGPASSVDGSGNLLVSMDSTFDAAERFARTVANSSYRPLSNPLTAHDAGSNVTVTVAGFSMRVAGSPDFACSGGTITGLSYGTRYFIYFDDATMAGGAETYNATTTKETAIVAAGRFYLGSIVTPSAAQADTVGNNDGGTGAQAGYLQVDGFHYVSHSGLANVTGIGSEFDGNSASALQTQETSGTGGSVDTMRLSLTDKFFFPPTNITLKVVSSGATSTAGGATLKYSINGGSTYTNIWQVTAGASRTKGLDSVTIPAGTPMSSIILAADVQGTTGFTNAQVDIYEAWVEVLS